jgi:hypothetical protein
LLGLSRGERRCGDACAALGRPSRPRDRRGDVDFRTGLRPATVMDRIAKGFSVDETAAIAAWYSEQEQ